MVEFEYIHMRLKIGPWYGKFTLKKVIPWIVSWKLYYFSQNKTNTYAMGSDKAWLFFVLNVVYWMYQGMFPFYTTLSFHPKIIYSYHFTSDIIYLYGQILIIFFFENQMLIIEVIILITLKLAINSCWSFSQWILHLFVINRFASLYSLDFTQRR